MTALHEPRVSEWSPADAGKLAELTAALRAAGQEPNVCTLAHELSGSDFLLVAELAGRPVGALLALPSAGNLGLVALPLAIDPRVPEPTRIEDALLIALPPALKDRQQALAYALLPRDEGAPAPLLARHGFQRLTELSYLQLDLAPLPAIEEGMLGRVPYSDVAEAEFAATLLATYRASQDCPELDGLRSVDEVLAGHAAVGTSARRRWSLLCVAGRTVGVELLAEFPKEAGVELVYWGLIPAARRKGLGRRFLRLTLRSLAHQGWKQLSLAVDIRNRPALQLYQSLGFQQTERKVIWWKNLR